MSAETEIEFVALYRTEIAKGGFGQVVARREVVEIADELSVIEGKTSVFDNGRSTLVPGGIYRAPGEVEGDKIKRLAIKGARYVGRASIDDAWRGYWQGIESAIKDAADRAAAERKAKSDKVAERNVAAIAAIAARLPYRQRHIFAAAIERRILDEANRIASK